MIEQVMRITKEDADVLPFLDAEPQSRAALVAIGRLLSNVSFKLLPGSPLMAWATGEEVDANWRAQCPDSPDSLWGNLSFLASLYGPCGTPNPYERLEELRGREDADAPNPATV